MALFIQRLVRIIWGNQHSNELWQRILKSSIACAIGLTIAVIPQVVEVFGLNTYLIPMTTVFAHPGQRMGKMIESMSMILLGSLLGLGWSLFGLYMSDIVVNYNAGAASSIRAIFLLVSVLFHGYVRSHSPRLFVFVWFFLIASVTVLMGKALEVTTTAFTKLEYPILTGTGVVLVVNLAIFPEHSTSYLGSSTVDTMSETIDTLIRATHWFLTPGCDSDEAKDKEEVSLKRSKKTWWENFLSGFPNPFKSAGIKASPDTLVSLTTMASLADRKTNLRALALACSSAQNEVNFEFSFSPLPPKSLKPISKHGMSSLVQNTITLIGACENKFVLLKHGTVCENEEVTGEASDPTTSFKNEKVEASVSKNLGRVLEEEMETEDERFQRRVTQVQPLREIELGSVEHLESLLRRIRGPVLVFEENLKATADLTISCLAYCYDVPKLPSGAAIPKGIELQKIDICIDGFTDALTRFDMRTTEELKGATLDESGQSLDLMPRMEMFLVSSFILGFRQAAIHILSMLRQARDLVEQRQTRHDRSRIWIPHHADFRQWLSTSGEADGIVLPESARRGARATINQQESSVQSSESSSSEETLKWQKSNEEAAPRALIREKMHTPQKRHLKSKPQGSNDKSSWKSKFRGKTADIIKWPQHSEDVKYSLKLALAVFMVSWPSFVPSWRAWYGEVRGIWAPLQLVLVFEVSIGTSLFIFFIRLFGVVFGCTMGLLSYEIGRGNRIAMVFILVVGIVPSVYIQISTKYVKAGMIANSTMCVVALAAMNQSGTAYENFYKRLVAFLVGSLVAIIVEVFIYPVRARHRLVESLASAVLQVQSMQAAVSIGIDSPDKPNFRSNRLHHRFSHARNKAQAALTAAETFLPFCLKEPRLKGSFRPLEPVYKEIIYVLHQILDRMDNIMDLRRSYGSSILEDLNAEVYAYRRNVAASNNLMLFAVHEAFTTRLPLPQFIPSSRLAQSRLVNRVREIIASRALQSDGVQSMAFRNREQSTVSIITERKFLSWNANTAGHMEVIEYLEELVELTKLLVGVNAFRSGLLERPQYKDYVQHAKFTEFTVNRNGSRRSEGNAGAATLPSVGTAAASAQELKRRRRSTFHADLGENFPQEDYMEDDRIPMSLRRVGLRLQRDSATVRRRGFTIGRS